MTFNLSAPFRAFAQHLRKQSRQVQLVFAALVFLGMTNSAWANPVVLLAGDTTITANICANETFPFDGQLLNTAGTYTATYEAADGSDSIVTLILGVSPVSESLLTTTICQGESFEFNGVQYTQSGLFSAQLTSFNGCDSTARLRLTVYPTVITKLQAGICAGTGYLFQGETLTDAGQYSVVLTTFRGCDSIVQLQLDVVPFFEIPVAAAICNGDSYLFNGELLEDAGVYEATFTAYGGCDSIVTLTLSILPVPVTTIPIGICEGTEYLYEGDLLTVSGVYTYTFTAANGCDSLVMIDLNVVTSFDVNATATICNGEIYSFGSQQLTTAGVYSNTFTAIGGCDSLVNLTLTVLPTQNTSIQRKICEGDVLEYNGATLVDAGVYQFVLTGSNGCDSTVLLTLIVLPIPNTIIEAIICEGDTYDFNGEILSDAGIYEQTYTAASNCDSVVSLILEVRPHSDSILKVTICNGETYAFNGATLDASGIFTQLLVAYNGCDSVLTLNLTVLPVLDSTLNVSICAGSSYEFDGVMLTDAGTYTGVFAGTNDCDSTVTLNLVILPTSSSSLTATVCAGSTYDFNGTSLTDAGTYTAKLTGANGCDSTVTLVLTQLPTQSTNIAASICAGEGFPYFGTVLTDAGNYEYVFAGENGCDSTVTIQLTVLPVSRTTLSATICNGAIYEYNGDTLTATGNYDFVFEAFNGCDSIVTLQLTVLPLASANLSVTLCSGASYDFDGQTLTDSGTYTSVTEGFNGCDSTTTLQLTFVMEFVTNLAVSICAGEEYGFNGDTLNVEGTYSVTLSSEGGCDSLVTLTLTVLPLSQSVTEVTICAGDTYLFNGDSLADAGAYTAVLTDANGCDSTVVLNLSVLPMQTTILEVTTCSNQPYSFNGLSLGQSGIYTAVLTSVNGCDSTVTLRLTVLPISFKTFSATTCANEGYVFDGSVLTQTGTYSATYAAANGCDSLVTLQLTVLPLAQSGTAALVCEGESFEYNGEVFTQSGTYTFNFPGAGANGCDSIETLFLTIYPIIPVTNTAATICAGETYTFDGETLTTSGTYTAELASATGCDSVVVLQLIVLSPVTIFISATICEGESYEFGGELLTEAGTYTENFIDANGCNAEMTLVLEVNVVNTTVTLFNGTLTAQVANAQYQWFDCASNQPIAGATSASFTPVVTGQYSVQITAANGCSGESDCITVQVVSVGEPWSQTEWSLQPNPASQLVSVMLNENVEGDLQVEIYDPAGRLLRQLQVSTGTRQLEVDLTDFPSGMLMVRLASERGTTSKMLMKAAR